MKASLTEEADRSQAAHTGLSSGCHGRSPDAPRAQRRSESAAACRVRVRYDEGSHRDATLCGDRGRRWDLPGRAQHSCWRGALAGGDHVPRRRGDARHHASDGRAVIGSGLCGPGARFLLPQRPLRPGRHAHRVLHQGDRGEDHGHDAGLHRRPGGARRWRLRRLP